jgi:hypothetical protein
MNIVVGFEPNECEFFSDADEVRRTETRDPRRARGYYDGRVVREYHRTSFSTEAWCVKNP